MKRCRGFTLIEVLIALAIVAIALTAIVKVASVTVEDVTHIKQKSIANWVAMNLIAQAQLHLIPASGQGETEMLKQSFVWKIKAEDTNTVNIKQLSVIIFKNSGNSTVPLIQRRGYLLNN